MMQDVILYDKLAYLWPVISPPEDYADEAAYWREALRRRLGPGRHCLLELGVGGGHNLSHLAGEFDAVAVDISPKMLELSRRLNPAVEHHLGDMRTFRLPGRAFDAVLIHDAVSYMLTEDDLRAAFAPARAERIGERRTGVAGHRRISLGRVGGDAGPSYAPARYSDRLR